MNINKLVWTQLSLDDALKPYFDDPSVYLTDDPEEIARRQRELTCLMENPKLAEAFEQLVVRFDELEALRMTTGADAKNSMHRCAESISAGSGRDESGAGTKYRVYPGCRTDRPAV